MLNHHLKLCAAALVLAAGTALGQTEPGEDFTALQAAYDADARNWPERYAAFKERYEALAAEHQGTDDEVRATLWLLKNTWWQRAEGTMNAEAEKIADDLLTRHAESMLLAELVDLQHVFDGATRQSVYASLLKSPHPEVQAAGHLGLGARGATEDERAHLQTLVDDYADVAYGYGTYGAVADARLNPLKPEMLEVGKVAPEIKGVDQNLKPMTLSSYRGKVVLLDFWGDW